MPYPCSEKKSSRAKWLPILFLLFVSVKSVGQVTWDGEGGDGQWSTAANWSSNTVPSATDDVLLDNSIAAGNYIVSLPGSISAIVIRTITITPAAGNSIQFNLPFTNTAIPALTATGAGYGITINNGGVFVNSSGASSGTVISITDSLRINNGGQYIHNTRSAHAAIVTVLSKRAGTEKGIFKFDAPGGGYTLASTGRTYGTIVFSAEASGGSQVYSTSAASPLMVNGDFILHGGVTVNFDLTAAATIRGSYMQDGGVFNLASQANNNVVYVKGDFIQTAGIITETSTGLPAIELNGDSHQNIQAYGSIINNVAFRINTAAGVSLLSGLVLPYSLDLLKGIVSTGTNLITLQAGCSIHADSLSNTSFINGRLRKEGLNAAAYFLFPVGKGNIQRWIELKEVTGNYTVEFLKADPHALSNTVAAGIHHTSSIEYWSVQADAIPLPNAKIELSFDNVNSGGVTDMATLRVAQLAAGIWADKGSTTTSGSAGSAGSVVSNSLTVFETGKTWFTLASSIAFQNPLPLQLLSFNGTIYNDAIMLTWRIAGSWRPDFFELESSADGIHFVAMSSTVTLSNQTDYQYTDKRKLSGKQFYRLKAVDMDGSIAYMKELQVVVPGYSVGAIQLWPSVVAGISSVIVNAPGNKKVQIKIYSMEGRLMQTMVAFVYAGRNAIPLQLSSLSAGTYILSVTGIDNGINSCRFIKSN